MIENLVIIVHVLTALAIVALILLQQGKGADMGASFGSGSSQTVFGAAGGGNALTKGTAILAALFFATSLGLAVYAKQRADSVGKVELSVPVVEEVAEDQLTPELEAVMEEIPDVAAEAANEEVPVVQE